MPDEVASAFRAAMRLEDAFVLQDQMGFDDVPGWDSVGHMNLVTELEARLGMSLDLQEIVALDSVKAGTSPVAQSQPHNKPCNRSFKTCSRTCRAAGTPPLSPRAGTSPSPSSAAWWPPPPKSCGRWVLFAAGDRLWSQQPSLGGGRILPSMGSARSRCPWTPTPRSPPGGK